MFKNICENNYYKHTLLRSFPFRRYTYQGSWISFLLSTCQREVVDRKTWSGKKWNREGQRPHPNPARARAGPCRGVEGRETAVFTTTLTPWGHFRPASSPES